MHTRCFLAMLLVLSMVCVITPAVAYLNDGADGGPHRKINALALAEFAKRAAGDPAFSLYTLSPTAITLGFTPGKGEHPFAAEGYTVIQSGDFYPEDQSGVTEYLANTAALAKYAPTYIVEQKTLRPFVWWITEGGYTADEPEIYMSLRHFYDPLSKGVANFSGNRNVPYLTDISDSVLANWVGGVMNPCIDAKRWALSESRYSWKDGQMMLTKAQVADAAIDFRRLAYGKAWRCLGESMHLLADMTVPAHVRNDAHPGKAGYISDPYEDYVTARIVEHNGNVATLDPALAHQINNCTTPEQLFDVVAGYTNRSFFSEETIAGVDLWIKTLIENANGQPMYPAPKINHYTFYNGGIQDGSGVYRDGNKNVIITRTKEGKLSIASTAPRQASLLIPLAIAANARLLELSMPRVGVRVDGYDAINGLVKFHTVGFTRDAAGVWNTTPLANFPGSSSGAVVTVVVNGKQSVSWLPVKTVAPGVLAVTAAPLLTGILAPYAPKGVLSLDHPDITMTVGLDMGGILVTSPAYSLPKLAISPATWTGAVGAPCTLQAIPPVPGVRYVWNFGDKSAPISVNGSSKCTHAYAKPGVYIITVQLYDAKNTLLGTAKATATIGATAGADVRTLLRKSIRVDVGLSSTMLFNIEGKTSTRYSSIGIDSNDVPLNWGPTGFSCVLNQKHGGSTTELTITGTISTDGRTLHSISANRKYISNDGWISVTQVALNEMVLETVVDGVDPANIDTLVFAVRGAKTSGHVGVATVQTHHDELGAKSAQSTTPTYSTADPKQLPEAVVVFYLAR
ncbi:MAG: PKD domain-containing protein [Armatimonadota bacterium]